MRNQLDLMFYLVMTALLAWESWAAPFPRWVRSIAAVGAISSACVVVHIVALSFAQ